MPTLTFSPVPPYVGVTFSEKEFTEFQKQLGVTASKLFKAKRKDFIGYFHIIAKHSGKCLDVSEFSQENCANVFQCTLHGGDNQQWILVKTPDGYFYIFAKHSGKCLDVEEYKQDDCANVWQYAFHGGDNQKWELRDIGNGYFHVIAKHSGKCLDVEGYKQDDCANVWQITLHGGDNQQWKLVPIK